MRGICLAYLGRHAGAVVDFKKSLELEPNRADLVEQLNISPQRLGKGGR